MAIDDAIAVFWFTSGDAFQHYFECSHNNRFKEPGFPDQNGYESFYLPLMVAPTASMYFVVIRERKRKEVKKRTEKGRHGFLCHSISQVCSLVFYLLEKQFSFWVKDGLYDELCCSESFEVRRFQVN